MSRLSRAIEHGRKAYFQQKGHPYRTGTHPDFTPYYDAEFFKQLQAHRRQQDEEHWARMAARVKKPPASPAAEAAASEATETGQPSSAETRKGFLGWPWFGRKQSTSSADEQTEAISNQSEASNRETVIPEVSSSGFRSPDHPITGSPDPAAAPISSATKTNAVPQSAPVPIGEVADSLAKYIREYLVCSDQQLVVLVLWIIHTHCFKYFPVTPYLSISSPEKQSGKTVCLQLLRLLCHNPWMPGGVRGAQLIGRIATSQPTLLLDDWHTAFRSSETQAIIGFLNAGTHQEGRYPVRASDEESDKSVFCPKAFAGVGRLPASLADRCIPIVLQRRKSVESVRSFWLDSDDDHARQQVKDIPAWAKDNHEPWVTPSANFSAPRPRTCPCASANMWLPCWPSLRSSAASGPKGPKRLWPVSLLSAPMKIPPPACSCWDISAAFLPFRMILPKSLPSVFWNT